MKFFSGWSEQSSDRRPLWLTLALLATLVAIIVIPELGRYFALLPIRWGAAAAIAAAVVIWALALRAIWRHRLFERFLSINESGWRP